MLYVLYVFVFCFFFFFFSSRRRHTRSLRDWSSDVCSSDLDSDAHIVRGLIAILLRLYSGRTPEAILGFDAKAAFERLGLTGALSAQRSNGLFSMVERIRRDAAESL